MIRSLIGFCGRNTFLVMLCTVLIGAWSIWGIYHTPLDALPDISDVQVIIFTEWRGQSPNLIEDQITYPLVTTFLSAPKVKLVRGFTMFGHSFVFVLFDDDTDLYWARSRVLEYLNNLQGKLPEGVTPQLGPDATGVGWVYQYAVIDETGTYDLQQLRSFQDWYLRYWLASVPGVAEVASVGGFEKQYQVEIDPIKLQAYNLSLPEITMAIRRSNNEVGGRVVELAEHEYIVRGRGYITNKDMLEQIVVGIDQKGTPIRIRDIAHLQIGGNIRRGVTDLNGEGEVAAGIVVMRHGENALGVINRVKAKLKEMEPAFPEGIKVIPVYDRSTLILNSMKTLFSALAEEILLVFIIIILFLFHMRSALVAIITLPIAVMLSFLPMYYMGLTANIMSFAGIIIAIGDVVDAAIVMVEKAHQDLEEDRGKNPRSEVIIESAKSIGPQIFGALLMTVISFFPVFTLQAQEGRLFSPLAYTKTFSVLFGALLGITLVPALMVLFIRGKIRPMMKNPFTMICVKIYRPLITFCVQYRHFVLIVAALLIFLTIPIYFRLGSEFMPPLDEETLFLMPITTPGISIETVKQLLQTQDKILYSFPEVQSVFGKAGRALTPTDPAPLSMIETVVTFKPKVEWRKGLTKEKLRTEIEEALHFEGVQSAFTMPIKARIDMLTTGIRTPVGVKVFGSDLIKINEIAEKLEGILRNIPDTQSVYAEREIGGFFIDFHPDREAIARYGLLVEDILDILTMAVGGMDIATTIEGRERYTINVRYPRELRKSIDQLRKVLVPIKTNKFGFEQVPLGLLGKVEAVMGPSMIKDEMGSLSGWVYIDTTRKDIGGYVNDAKIAVAQQLILPPGYFLKWTGQYEYLERMQSLMKTVIPFTLILIFIILFLTLGGVVQALIVMLSVPFSMVGAVWLLYALGYNTSVAVWVGIIALFGIGAETASIVIFYLEEGFSIWKKANKLNSMQDLITMVISYGSLKIRPVLMAVGLNIFGLIPIMYSTDVGSDVAKRMAAPLWGGLISLTILSLLLIPALYVVWRGRAFNSKAERNG